VLEVDEGILVKASADTFWECFDTEDSRKSPYGNCHNNSYCYAWSCTSSYLLRVLLKDFLASRKHSMRGYFKRNESSQKKRKNARAIANIRIFEPLLFSSILAPTFEI
jgi:hypothetical protein